MPTNMLLRHILPNNSCTSGKQMEMETIWGWGQVEWKFCGMEGTTDVGTEIKSAETGWDWA